MSAEPTSAYSYVPLDLRLRAFGCPPLIRLDQPLNNPSQIDYLDLLPRKAGGGEPLSAVAEHQGTALLYVLDAASPEAADPTRIASLQRQLANRSDPAWLGVARPGSLELYPVSFHPQGLILPAQTVSADEQTSALFFQRLVQGTLDRSGEIRGTDYVFRKIFDLLTQTTDQFVDAKPGKRRLQPLHVLSMAGRALFFRFLIDRQIVEPEECGEICPAADGLKDAFATAEKAAQTSAWLDETFNGDFLRLIDESIPESDRPGREQLYLNFYRGVERRVGANFFNHLDAILKGWRARDGAIQMELDWGDLDFAHIPVGVLSQVYESFSHRVDPEVAREASVHYTPRVVARMMVDQAFAAIKNPAQAMVLDPACGAGIFLVLALRRLVSERWQADQKRPDTRTIQHILYQQLRGFDISRSALRLAALALYITAIELNATPRPPKSLPFPARSASSRPAKRGAVLLRPRCGRSQGRRLGRRAGSPLAGQPRAAGAGHARWQLRSRHRQPSLDPTTRARGPEHSATKEGAAGQDEVNSAQRGVHQNRKASLQVARGLADLAQTYSNPDKNPDLPFLWRATEWAKKRTESSPWLCRPGSSDERRGGEGSRGMR